MKLFYLRNKKKHPVACVAWDYEVDERILFAVSTHNPLDHYDKEVGRALAVGRLGFNPHSLSITSSLPARITSLLRIIAESREFPTRTRNAATYWLEHPPQPKTRKSKAA